jgi:hypothetical protein
MRNQAKWHTEISKNLRGRASRAALRARSQRVGNSFAAHVLPVRDAPRPRGDTAYYFGRLMLEIRRPHVSTFRTVGLGCLTLGCRTL